ncbi:MAG: MCP four helix bundle domain-containing protein, partial [Chitinispirillales bacterium]|nr:MCP four helix bundle domain-containing protein [Chitinispirillales bacterium]
MKNLKVSMKLLVGFGIMVALILTISLISVFSLLGIDNTYSDVIVRHAMPLNPAINVVGNIQAMRSETRNCVIFSGNKDKVREAKTALDRLSKEFEDSAQSFGKSIVSPDAKAKFTEAMRQYNEVYKPGAYKLVEEGEKNAPLAEMIELLAAIKDASDLVTNTMVEVSDLKVENLVQSSNDCTNQSKNSVALMVVILVVSVVIAVIFGVYISALISKPLGVTVNMINEMSRGHLDMRLRLDRQDEIGVMAKTMDNFADDLQNNVVGNMKKISDGDLEMNIELKDSKDEVSAALKNTVEALHALIIDDGGKVLLAAAGKDMSQRLTREYKGDY